MSKKLSLAELLNVSDFRNLKFGCRPGAGIRSVRANIGIKDSSAGFEVVENYNACHTPADSQILGSCTCNAFTGVIEDFIFRATGKVVQLDYDRLYKAVRNDVYGDDADEGAQLEDPFNVAKSRGLIPPDSVMTRLSLDAAAICSALKKGPIVVGMSVHEGWSPDAMNLKNGAVDESQDASLVPYTNGHAMKVLSTNIHNEVDLLVLRQSWGSIGIHGEGLVCTTFAHFLKWAIDYPLAVDLGPSWPDFRGWEDWVQK
jgi:hypothetical protein